MTRHSRKADIAVGFGIAAIVWWLTSEAMWVAILAVITSAGAVFIAGRELRRAVGLLPSLLVLAASLMAGISR